MGRPGRQQVMARQLRPLWFGAGHLIINGDVAELQNPLMQAEGARQIQHLQDSCDADGVRLTMLSGNHDAYLSDQRHLMLANGLVMLTHGDVLHPAVAPWSSAAQRMRKETASLLSRLDPDQRHDLNMKLSAAQHVSHYGSVNEQRQEIRYGTKWILMRPWRVAQVIGYWMTVPKYAARFALLHAPEARIVLFGHSHRQGIWQRLGRTVINTGSFVFPGRPRAVVLEGNRLSVWRIVRTHSQYNFGRTTIAQFELPLAPPLRKTA